METLERLTEVEDKEDTESEQEVEVGVQENHGTWRSPALRGKKGRR